jgi:BMFP domain-containing protein YqiC
VFEDIEGQTAQAMEQLVAGEAFSELLSRVTENVVAVSKISSDVGDLVLRNLRIAGRSDIDRLARQLARTEDKLELLLQAVERLEDSRLRK